MRAPTVLDRVRGVLVGLAVGDALRAPVEFDGPETIVDQRKELFALPGGGSFHWAPAEFTDDTQQAILLAWHLQKHQGAIDQDDLVQDLLGWLDGAADVGVQTRKVLRAVDEGKDWRQASSMLPPTAQGNGSLMRTAAVALASPSRQETLALARAQSAVTHPAPNCLESCAAYCWLLRGVLETGEFDLDGARERATELAVQEAIDASRATKIPPMSGWVLHTLTGALWAVQRATCFDDAIWNAVCLGHDADTVGAVTGALAGARWGYSGITRDLARKIQSKHPAFAGQYPELLVELAESLAASWLTPEK